MFNDGLTPIVKWNDTFSSSIQPSASRAAFVGGEIFSSVGISLTNKPHHWGFGVLSFLHILFFFSFLMLKMKHTKQNLEYLGDAASQRDKLPLINCCQ